MDVNEEDLKEAARKAKDSELRRKKVEELRKMVLNDDDEVLQNHSEESSIASSSVEGVYPKGNPQCLLKHSEQNSNETCSIISLGKIGSILGGRDIQSGAKDIDAVSVDSKYSISEVESLKEFVPPKSQCSEPDVVASTKNEQVQHPVAPPRRKKRNKNSQSVSSNVKTNSSIEHPSPADPIESITRELEYSLDLHSATRGQYCVKPQDREQDRAEGPNNDNGKIQMSLPIRSQSYNNVSSKSASDASETAKGSSSEEVLQPYMVRTRSDSGRPLTDQVFFFIIKLCFKNFWYILINITGFQFKGGICRSSLGLCSLLMFSQLRLVWQNNFIK
ncbi:uncharacterized protein LOC118183370 isoform X2 [Stegodyphus dumicola]|nr:uncharacterized protein LOC118183370 isoform X2 [Stegodyphus dumicola]